MVALSFSWICHRILAKIKYLLNDYKGALADLNRADQAEPDNHVTLRSKLDSYHHLCTTQTWGQLYRLNLFSETLQYLEVICLGLPEICFMMS